MKKQKVDRKITIEISPYDVDEITSFYGNLTDEQIKEVVYDILGRYCNSDYFDPDLTFES